MNKCKKIKTYERDEDVYYPVPMDYTPIRVGKPPSNQRVVRRIVQETVRLAYSLVPKQWDYHGKHIKPKEVATSDQVETVMHLVESLQPSNAIEAALASQFVITYIRAMEEKDYNDTPTINLELFEFGHKVLETLQKYRNKGGQMQVQYNVNQGQVVNIKNIKKEEQPISMEEVSCNR